MGCAQSNDSRVSETKTKQIEKNLKDKSLKKNNEVSLLLLGAGESGKTTFLKQMKILNANGYTDAERDQFKPLIHSNVILAMKALVLCLKKQNELDKIPEAKKKHANYFIETDELTLVQETLGGEMTSRIKSLWEEEPIKKQQELTRSFDTFENAPHFFDEIDRLSQSSYIPSPDDLLRCRSKTTGINEVVFPLKADVYCRMVDVGGQRSERRKWIYSFNGVDSVLFFVSLSEYDQTLQEDLNCPRLVESKKLFMDICKCKWFVGTPFIIFLNKYDLFCDKIKRVPLKNYYSDYTGGDDVKAGVDFIKNYIIECLEPKDREVYVHTTCATDTDNIRKVFNSLRDIFLTRSLKSNGFV